MDIGELILDIMRKQIEFCNSAEVVKDDKGRIVWKRVRENDEKEEWVDEESH